MSDTTTERRTTRRARSASSFTSLTADHLGSDLTLEQLVHALTRVLDASSPSSGRDLLRQLQARQILDVERGLRDALSVIDAIKNPLLPVNRIPPEILTEVLRYRASEEELIAATHVCRHWRSYLLSAPSLWTNFCCTNIDRIHTYLARCKSAPVSIDMTVGCDPFTFGHIVYCAANVASVRLDGPLDLMDQWMHHFGKPLPSLRSLELIVRPGPRERGSHRTLFLHSHAPSLRRLILRGMYPPTDTPLPNLSAITLQLYKIYAPIHLNSIFASLNNAPNLQELRILLGACEVILSEEVVALGRLEYLKLVMDGRPLRILPLMRLPRLRNLTLCVTLHVDFPTVTLADLLPPSHCISLTGVGKMTYKVEGARVPSRTVTFSTQHLAVTVFARPDPHILTDSPFTTWFSDTSPVSLTQIKKVKVYGPILPGEIPFAAFENLEVLNLDGSDHNLTFALLSARTAGGLTSCPRLRTLSVRWRCDLDRKGLVRLNTLARRRKAGGSPFDDVSVVGFVVCQPNLVEELRGYVGSLDLSGVIKDPA